VGVQKDLNIASAHTTKNSVSTVWIAFSGHPNSQIMMYLQSVYGKIKA